jgi:hypothetical protein
VESTGIEKVAGCTKDESDARNELDNRWSEFGASSKQACIGESSVGAGQSYVADVNLNERQRARACLSR